jgi:hypothetical protein
VTDRKQDHFERRAQAVLQESAERLDGRTQSRLTQARHAALDAARRPGGSRKPYMWIPAGVAAAAALSVLLLTDAEQVASPSAAQLAAAPIDEFDIIAAEDSLEFYRDVDFYAWLAATDLAETDEEPAPDSEV